MEVLISSISMQESKIYHSSWMENNTVVILDGFINQWQNNPTLMKKT